MGGHSYKRIKRHLGVKHENLGLRLSREQWEIELNNGMNDWSKAQLMRKEMPSKIGLN